MKCPYCGHLGDKVVDSRESKEGDVIRRRRQCLNDECQKRFTSYERIDEIPYMVVKKDGTRERFERQEKARPEGHGGPQAMETRDWVRNLLGRFDQETQAAAIHYHVDEMTLEEVAALLGRSVPTIRKRLEHFATVGGQEALTP